MLWVRKIFKFYLDASIHVALAVISLYWITVQNLNIPCNFDYVIFLFFSTIVCYNFIKYGVEAKKYVIVTKPYHKSIQIFSFLAFIVSLIFFLQLGRELWIPIVLLSILSGLYAIPFLPNSKNLRSLGAWKIVLVALIWTGLTGWLPLLDSGIPFTTNLFWLLVLRFLLVLILMLPFEIRDVHLDPQDLGTLPQLFGVTKTKYVGYVLVLLYVLLEVATRSVDSLALVRLALLVVCLWFALYRSSIRQTRYFSAFWVEGIPILMALVEYMM